MKLSIDQVDQLSYHHIIQQIKLLVGWWVRRLVPWDDQMATMAMVRPVVSLRTIWPEGLICRHDGAVAWSFRFPDVVFSYIYAQLVVMLVGASVGPVGGPDGDVGAGQPGGRMAEMRRPDEAVD